MSTESQTAAAEQAAKKKASLGITLGLIIAGLVIIFTLVLMNAGEVVSLPASSPTATDKHHEVAKQVRPRRSGS